MKLQNLSNIDLKQIYVCLNLINLKKIFTNIFFNLNYLLQTLYIIMPQIIKLPV